MKAGEKDQSLGPADVRYFRRPQDAAELFPELRWGPRRDAFVACRAAIRHFLNAEQAGVIINVSNVHQVIPKPRFLSYSISKGGMQNLTRTLALEYANRGIRVNAIGPGATVTPINRTWVDDPKKAAAVTAFLASDEAAYITGQTLFVDGGLTLYPDFRTAWSSE